jgi:acyl-CoA synthetase (AMP-forming)/AMP-acid ligase II
MDKRTLGQVLDANIAHHGNRPAIIAGQDRWTYGEFGARIYKLAEVLADLGLSRGDRYGIFAKIAPRSKNCVGQGSLPVLFRW